VKSANITNMEFLVQPCCTLFGIARHRWYIIESTENRIQQTKAEPANSTPKFAGSLFNSLTNFAGSLFNSLTNTFVDVVGGLRIVGTIGVTIGGITGEVAFSSFSLVLTSANNLYLKRTPNSLPATFSNRSPPTPIVRDLFLSAASASSRVHFGIELRLLGNSWRGCGCGR
jgi:hypothetical protein